jgi:hypothetical protein
METPCIVNLICELYASSVFTLKVEIYFEIWCENVVLPCMTKRSVKLFATSLKKEAKN